ncbi:MAG: hypothetical protein ABIG89_06255 [Candidatus Woesearchaeota archaeon]
MAHKIEIVDIEPLHCKMFNGVCRLVSRYKLATAILLDVCDLFFGNIPLLNTMWDFITCGVLLLILKNKYLAFFALGELLFPGTGRLIKEIDAFFPSATILYLIDQNMSKIKIKKNPFHKEFKIEKKKYNIKKRKKK